MVNHTLTEHFSALFGNLNPSPTFVQQAAREHQTVTRLIENAGGITAQLAPKCFLQGSYKQDTAIYTINDVDIVVLCELWYPGSGTGAGRSWSRDQIFDAIAAPLLADGRYKNKVQYRSTSMCIKVDLGIKLEILPVVFKAETFDPAQEPFQMYRPGTGRWEDGYARYHQDWLTRKNKQTGGNFIPAIKVVKHLRSLFDLDGISFHIECLLFALPDWCYSGGPAEYFATILQHLVSKSASDWYRTVLRTPCGERDIFVSSEWEQSSWHTFHKAVETWTKCASLANAARDRGSAIEAWQVLLGNDFFPERVGQ